MLAVKKIAIVVPTHIIMDFYIEELSNRLPGEYSKCRGQYRSNSQLVEVKFIVGTCTDCMMGTKFDTVFVGTYINESFLSFIIGNFTNDVRYITSIRHTVDAIVEIHNVTELKIHSKVREDRYNSLINTMHKIMEDIGIDISSLKDNDDLLHRTVVDHVRNISHAYSDTKGTVKHGL